MLVNINERKQKIKEFESLVDEAISANHMTDNQFFDKLHVDPLYMERLLNGELYNLPHPKILKRIADNSKNTVTYDKLMRVCGYSLSKLTGVDCRTVMRGDIFYVDLGNDIVGCEQGKIRPVIIIQNPSGNKHSPTVIVSIITSQLKSLNMPTHVVLGQDCGLEKVSMVSLEQIRTIDKKRLQEYVGTVTREDMKKIDKATKISLGVYSETDRLVDMIENVNEDDTNKEISVFKKLLRFLTGKMRNKELRVA